MIPVTRSGGAAPWLRLAVLCVLATLASCTPAAFFNNTVTLGGNVPGQRGGISVMFVNETPYRAIFTFGTYDPQNTTQNTAVSFPIEFDQLFVDADATNRLDPHSSSEIFTFSCGRALSVGGQRLVDLILENDLDEDANAIALRPLPDPVTGEARSRAGIAFSDRDLDADGASDPTGGWSEGVVTLQGAEYQCDSLLIYTFVQDGSQPGGIRIDLSVILP